jgi:hypothetical protein
MDIVFIGKTSITGLPDVYSYSIIETIIEYYDLYGNTVGYDLLKIIPNLSITLDDLPTIPNNKYFKKQIIKYFTTSLIVGDNTLITIITMDSDNIIIYNTTIVISTSEYSSWPNDINQYPVTGVQHTDKVLDLFINKYQIFKE